MWGESKGGERVNWVRSGHFSADITGGNLDFWYLLWGAGLECSDPGWSLWGDFRTLSLVYIGASLASCQSLAVLLKKLEIIGYPCWESFPSTPLWAKRGNQQCANFMPGVSPKCWASAGRNALACVCCSTHSFLREVSSLKSVKLYLTENNWILFSWSMISYYTVGFLYLGRFVSCSSF